MITKTQAFKTADDKTFDTIELAQRHELATLLKLADDDGTIVTIMDQKDAVIDILTTTPRSKPKARKIHGGTKKPATKKPQAKARLQPMPAEPPAPTLPGV